MQTTTLVAQEKSGFIPDFRLSQSTLVSSGKDLPFWMVANQNGVFTLHNSSYFLSQAGLTRSLERAHLKIGGTHMAPIPHLRDGFAGTSDFHPNPARAGLAWVPVPRADSKSRCTERSGYIWQTLLHER